jgi:hypothetical protein
MRVSIAWSAAALLFAGIVDAAGPDDTAVVTSIKGDTIELTVPASALVLTFPKGGLAEMDKSGNRAAESPRYFGFAHLQRGLVMSGWIEPASAFKGYKEFWVGEFTAMKEGGLMPVEPPTPVDIVDWVAIAYELPLPKTASNAVNTHIRAELVKNGTWVDLHISVTGDMPLADARSEALELLKSVVVTKKGT